MGVYDNFFEIILSNASRKTNAFTYVMIVHNYILERSELESMSRHLNFLIYKIILKFQSNNFSLQHLPSILNRIH